MKKIKITIIVGARPNFIKIAPLLKEMKRSRGINFLLIHTGQHYSKNMSEIFFKKLNIPDPEYNLNVGSGSHSKQTAKAMERLDEVIEKEKPDLVLVVGDVNSTLAGSLVAAKRNIPLVHLESGLRSFDKRMPEEVNRKVTDHLSDVLFCPTETAVSNLSKEGIEKNVFNVGDVMYDIFLERTKKITEKKEEDILKGLKVGRKEYSLLTIHRPQNTDDAKKLNSIIKSLVETGENIVFPVHPRTAKKIGEKTFKNILLLNPLSYLDMLILEKNAWKIITDSGGVQKEAFWFKVPCVTLRDSTEWPETLSRGWNVLVGADKDKIIKSIKKPSPKFYHGGKFGNGKAALKITKYLIKIYGR